MQFALLLYVLRFKTSKVPFAFSRNTITTVPISSSTQSYSLTEKVACERRLSQQFSNTLLMAIFNLSLQLLTRLGEESKNYLSLKNLNTSDCHKFVCHSLTLKQWSLRLLLKKTNISVV